MAWVIGANARRLRGDHKTDELARAATASGLRWGTGRVADLEAGRVSPTLPTLLALCAAFSDLLRRPVRLTELLDGDYDVVINEDTVVPVADVRSALSGEPVELQNRAAPVEDLLVDATKRLTLKELVADHPEDRVKLLLTWQAFGEAEERAARSLGVDKATMTQLMHRLWGGSLSGERDRRAGPDASAQKRGHIARQLKDELRRAIAEQAHGDD